MTVEELKKQFMKCPATLTIVFQRKTEHYATWKLNNQFLLPQVNNICLHQNCSSDNTAAVETLSKETQVSLWKYHDNKLDLLLGETLPHKKQFTLPRDGNEQKTHYYIY